MEIKLDNVSYMDNAEVFLQNIYMSFSVNNVYFILGKSGSSKTTLLDLISGTKKVTGGDIYYNNKKIENKERISKLDISYIKSDSNFITNTVYEEIMISCFPKPIKDLEKNLKKINLKKDILDRKINTLSKTEKKKVQILLSLFEDREVILLDEPTIGMSYEEKVILSKIIKKIKKNKTIIIASKDTEFMLLIEGIIYVLNNRKLVKKGTRYEILKDEKLLKKIGLKVPDILYFINLVSTLKNINLPNRDNILDLIKDVYRNV